MTRVRIALLTLLAALTIGAAPAGAATKPTVVLVHGAFADASSWSGVITRLQSKGVPVTAPANPLRGITVGTVRRDWALEHHRKWIERDKRPQ